MRQSVGWLILIAPGVQDEKQELEAHVRDLEEELANEKIELQRYKTLLENEKGKVLELEQLHHAEDKSEIEQLVESTRWVSHSVTNWECVNVCVMWLS